MVKQAKGLDEWFFFFFINSVDQVILATVTERDSSALKGTVSRYF